MSLAGYFCGQTSQLHTAQKTERDSPWNRIWKTGFLWNCFVLSRLWQTAIEDDHSYLELVCHGRIEEMNVWSILCWLWMDFLLGLLCVWLTSLPTYPLENGLQEQSSQKGGEGSLSVEALLAFFLKHQGRQGGRWCGIKSIKGEAFAGVIFFFFIIYYFLRWVVC